MSNETLNNLLASIKHFDTEKVIKVMRALSWTWAVDGKTMIPCRTEIIKTIIRLAIDAVNYANSKYSDPGVPVSSGTGGLEVTYLPWKNKFVIQFITESTDVYTDIDEDVITETITEKENYVEAILSIL